MSPLPPAGCVEGSQARSEHVQHVTEEAAVVEGEPEQNGEEEERNTDKEDDLSEAMMREGAESNLEDCFQ